MSEHAKHADGYIAQHGSEQSAHGKNPKKRRKMNWKERLSTAVIIIAAFALVV